MTAFQYAYEYKDVFLSSNEEIPDEIVIAYIERGIEHFGDKLKRIILTFDGDFVGIHYLQIGDRHPFERVRRITGYLVGTLDRFNDAKLAEVNDRVKHETTNF